MEENLPSHLQSEFGSLKRRRALLKSKITLYFKKLNKLKEEDSLSNVVCTFHLQEIKELICKIKEIDSLIVELFNNEAFTTEIIEGELDFQISYNLEVNLKVEEWESLFKVEPKTNLSETVNSEKLFERLNQLNLNETSNLPKLNCSVFSGKEPSKFAFSNFLSKFNNVIGFNEQISKAKKLQYLFSYVKDYALSIISHLSIVDSNYDIAIELLKEEFLDIPFLIDETCILILDLKIAPGFDIDFMNLKTYINTIRNYIYELKNYDMDFTIENSAGCKLISLIVFQNLPNAFKKEIIHKLGNNYPCINDIFLHYNEIIKTLMKTSIVKNVKQSDSSVKPKTKVEIKNKTKFSNDDYTLKNFQNNNKVKFDKGEQSDRVKFLCKLCQLSNHKLGYCDKYKDLQAKLDRLKALNLCNLCAGNHETNNCHGIEGKLKYPCAYCNLSTHITPLCPKREKVNTHCISLLQRTESNYLSPTISLDFLHDGKWLH